MCLEKPKTEKLRRKNILFLKKIFPINLKFYIDRSKYLTAFTTTLKEVYSEYENNTGDFCKTRRLKSSNPSGKSKTGRQNNYPTKRFLF